MNRPSPRFHAWLQPLTSNAQTPTRRTGWLISAALACGTLLSTAPVLAQDVSRVAAEPSGLKPLVTRVSGRVVAQADMPDEPFILVNADA
ncbi:MAG TPA: hypothetical protein VGE36_17435 [Roseateles sp.]